MAEGRDKLPGPPGEPPPEQQDGRGPIARLAGRLLRASVALALVLLAAEIYNRFEIGALWDDAYIFQRYAGNLLAGDGLAWQPGGHPSYGLTALLYLVPAALGRLAAGGNPSLGAMLASTATGVVFLALLARLLWAHTDTSRTARTAALVLTLFCLAWSFTPVHFTTGMDTELSLGYLAGLLILGHRFERQPTRRGAVALGLAGGLCFWVRPDLTTFGLAIPAALLVLGRGERQRRLAGLALGLAVATLGLIALGNWLYFGSLLPLPFYGKSMGLYGGSLHHVYRGAAGKGLVELAGHYWPLLLIVGLEVTARRGAFWRQAPPLDRAVLAAALVTVLYYWLLALPVMGMESRFYQPAAVALAFLAARALGRAERRHAGALGALSSETRALVACAALLGLWALTIPKLVGAAKTFSDKVSRRPFEFDIWAQARRKKNGPSSYWYKLAQFSALPDDLVIAATEVGFPGALNPRKTIIDLAGLNEPRFAHAPFDADLLLDELKPDLIYMPHQDYRKLNETLRQHPHFKDYLFFDKRRTRTRKFGVAIRRSSRHFDAMRALCPVAPEDNRAMVRKLRGVFR